MNDSPDRYRKEERHKRRNVVLVMVGAFVASLLLIGQFVQNYETHQVVSGHNTELVQINAATQKIKSLTQEIKTKQAQHSQTLEQLAALTKQLAVDKATIQAGTNEGLADYSAICAAAHATDGCTLPYPAQPVAP